MIPSSRITLRSIRRSNAARSSISNLSATRSSTSRNLNCSASIQSRNTSIINHNQSSFNSITRLVTRDCNLTSLQRLLILLRSLSPHLSSILSFSPSALLILFGNRPGRSSTLVHQQQHVIQPPLAFTAETFGNRCHFHFLFYPESTSLQLSSSRLHCSSILAFNLFISSRNL